MIVEAHGSFATQRCIECGTDFPDQLMKKMIMTKEVPRCFRKTCNGLVKPDIVFFGEALPEAFHKNRSLPAQADLAIVMGTSLTVQPFASLPSFVREETPRILINLERVGGLGGRADDVLLLGDCDTGVRKLADALGWREELESLWKKTVQSEVAREEQKLPAKTRDEKLEDEVEKLTQEIDKSLKLSEEHTAWLKDHLSVKHNLDNGSKDNPTPATVSAQASSGGANGGDAEALTNDEEKSSSAPAEAQEEGKGGIAHVYPHIEPEEPAPLEKPSL
jgi:NAD+-dependent protein deacetylase SIR2